MDRPEEIIAEDEAGKGGGVGHHGDEHRPPARGRRAGKIERHLQPVADRLARLFRDLGGAGPQPPEHHGKRGEGGEQRGHVEMIGGQDEHRAEHDGGQHRLPARRAEADDGDGARIEHGGDDRLAPTLLRIGQEEATFVDLLHEILLVPDRVTALDQGDRADAPVLVIGQGQPFERASVPRVALALGPGGGECEVEADDRDAGGEQIGADRRGEVQPADAQFGRIGEDAAGHPLQPRQVHGEEGEIGADEHDPEGDAAHAVGQFLAGDERPVIIEAAE